MVVRQDFRLVRRGSTATEKFITCHEDFQIKELYATNRMVNITGEGPEKDLLDLERPSLDSSIASSVVP